MLLFILLPLLRGLLNPCLFCLPVSIVCLQLRGNPIFYLRSINLSFPRRLGFFLSSPALLQETGWMSVFRFLKNCFLPLPGFLWGGSSAVLISGTCYLFIQREGAVTSAFPVL